MRQKEFQTCFGKNMEENSNDAYANREEVNFVDNYDHLSQLRVNKKVDEVQSKWNYKL